jgi:hypothetical protein
MLLELIPLCQLATGTQASSRELRSGAVRKSQDVGRGRRSGVGFGACNVAVAINHNGEEQHCIRSDGFIKLIVKKVRANMCM